MERPRTLVLTLTINAHSHDARTAVVGRRARRTSVASGLTKSRLLQTIVLEYFAEKISLHGVKFLTRRYLHHRLFWLLITVAILVLLGVQIYQRIQTLLNIGHC